MSYITLKQFKDSINIDYRNISRYDHNTCKWVGTDGIVRYRMYQTDIVTVDKGVIILDNGGWATRTTKNKINQILEDITAQYNSIFQKGGVWYYKNILTPFFNGMRINNNGKVLNASKGVPELKRKVRIKKLIDRYCKKLNKLKTLPLPDSGDCWWCSGFASIRCSNSDHLLFHLKEQYIHGTLILNALKARGYGDPHFIFRLAIDNMSIRSNIVNAVRHYFKDRFGIPR